IPTAVNVPTTWSIAWSPDGKVFATGEVDVRTWFAGSGDAKTVLKGHTKDVVSIAFLPDSKTLVTGSSDKTVNVWDLSEGAVKGTIKCADEVSAISVSPDGKQIAVALGPDGKKNVLLYNLSDVVK